MIFLDYSKHWAADIGDDSEWRKAASSGSMRKLKPLRPLFERIYM